MIGSTEMGIMRNHLGAARDTLKKRGHFDGEAFEIMWSVDNNVESALNWLIELEKILVDIGE